MSHLIPELQYQINQNDPTFVDPNPGFSPDLGDMLYVQSIDPETGEETWCTTPQYNFDLVSGAVPAVGDTVTYVGLDAKGVPLYEPTSIVPLGGTTDQQLYKVSTEDYDLEWKTRASQTFFGRSEPSNWIVGDLWGQGYE